ncbi:hypothetical protein SADUNF_Sadunf19G0090500 [Salix dunnii]|uniref:Uncharacterized protein n=1 Tax=Salix dunnii TaxID=1413687 RepID=A0A835J1X6_9ROSI|nr:hypothetical protein SADUNF_Sadunf19G0090500 [Salix dunnii]
MEEVKSAMEAHLDQMTDLVQKLSSELRSGLRPAIDNFIGFFHAIDWKINSLFSLCYMIVRWKRAELRHRARLARESNKQD